MPRLTQIDPQTAQGKGKELLDAVKSKLGIVPNMTRAMANSPSVLEGYLGLSGAVASGVLTPQLREKIALRSAQVNGCGYCLAAHTAIGKSVKLQDNEITDARQGVSTDATDSAAIAFADAIIEKRGAVSDEDVQAVRDAGFGDGEIAEIISNVVLNIFTNYFNRAAQTDVDFPKVDLDVSQPVTA
ncbi:MAG: carboxymuconolactone decarboxylase family protein [Phycisphaerales bacterium JB043]